MHGHDYLHDEELVRRVAEARLSPPFGRGHVRPSELMQLAAEHGIGYGALLSLRQRIIDAGGPDAYFAHLEVSNPRRRKVVYRGMVVADFDADLDLGGILDDRHEHAPLWSDDSDEIDWHEDPLPDRIVYAHRVDLRTPSLTPEDLVLVASEREWMRISDAGRANAMKWARRQLGSLTYGER